LEPLDIRIETQERLKKMINKYIIWL
jgi:hypothetical protein